MTDPALTQAQERVATAVAVVTVTGWPVGGGLFLD